MSKPVGPIRLMRRQGLLGMEQTPESHAAEISAEAKTLIYAKYLRGQQEHGGQLWRKQGILDMALEEAIDQVIYLLTLRDQIVDAGVVLGDTPE